MSVDQTAINLEVLFSLQKRKLSESFNRLSSSLPTKLYKIVRVKLPKTYLYNKKKLYFYQPFCDLIVYKQILLTKRALISPSSILSSHFMVNGLPFAYFAFHLCFYDSLCFQSNKCEFWWYLDKINRYNALWLLDWTKGGGGGWVKLYLVHQKSYIPHASCFFTLVLSLTEYFFLESRKHIWAQVFIFFSIYVFLFVFPQQTLRDNAS